MDILYLLIPLSTGLVLVIAGVFAWATFGGQFEGLEHEGERILSPDGDRVDCNQADDPAPDKKSAGPNPNTTRA